MPGRPAGTYLTVNLSPSALTSEAVARVLPERLDDLVIEITENEVLAEDPEIAAALADVRAPRRAARGRRHRLGLRRAHAASCASRPT